MYGNREGKNNLAISFLEIPSSQLSMGSLARLKISGS